MALGAQCIIALRDGDDTPMATAGAMLLTQAVILLDDIATSLRTKRA